LRWAFTAALVVFIALPALLPLRALISFDAWQWTADDGARLLYLGENTFTLCAGTLIVVLPAGILLASLLFRTSFFARRLLLCILALLLFVPLPVIVSSWQGMFGPDGWLPMEFWRSEALRPWATGIGAAIWIHAAASLPWATFIIGIGMLWVEPELEDSAAQVVAPWRVWLFVTLPRVRASILAAALFVVLQTEGEISVTDMMLVGTIAEETHTQFTLGDRDGVARTIVVTLPMALLVWASVLFVVSRLERGLPPIAPPTRVGRSLRIGPGWLRFLIALALLLLIGVPLVSIVWKLGLTGHPGHWDASEAWRFLDKESRALGQNLLTTVLAALITGCFIVSQALILCWLARDCAWFRWLIFSVLTWAWVLPGPVIGIALDDLIRIGVRVEPIGIWTAVMYEGPSPAPVIWVQTMRVLPIAVLFLWPVVRMVPRELSEQATLSGASPWGVLLYVLLPTTWRAGLVTTLAASALCLAEVGGSLRVYTPGWEPFASILFGSMHYGVQNTLAALSLMLLGSIALLALVMVGVWIMIRPRNRG
jgi:iron(III) transport system permease protein